MLAHFLLVIIIDGGLSGRQSERHGEERPVEWWERGGGAFADASTCTRYVRAQRSAYDLRVRDSKGERSETRRKKKMKKTSYQ